jgi:hypothetical protein
MPLLRRRHLIGSRIASMIGTSRPAALAIVDQRRR